MYSKDKSYSEAEKQRYIELFKKSKQFPYEFAKSNGIHISEFKLWLREASQNKENNSLESETEFGIININMVEETTTLGLRSSNGFKFENDTIKIELKQNYDKALLRTLMGVLVG